MCILHTKTDIVFNRNSARNIFYIKHALTIARKIQLVELMDIWSLQIDGCPFKCVHTIALTKYCNISLYIALWILQTALHQSIKTHLNAHSLLIVDTFTQLFSIKFLP